MVTWAKMSTDYSVCHCGCPTIWVNILKPITCHHGFGDFPRGGTPHRWLRLCTQGVFIALTRKTKSEHFWARNVPIKTDPTEHFWARNVPIKNGITHNTQLNICLVSCHSRHELGLRNSMLYNPTDSHQTRAHHVNLWKKIRQVRRCNLLFFFPPPPTLNPRPTSTQKMPRNVSIKLCIADNSRYQLVTSAAQQENQCRNGRQVRAGHKKNLSPASTQKRKAKTFNIVKECTPKKSLT